MIHNLLQVGLHKFRTFVDMFLISNPTKFSMFGSNVSSFIMTRPPLFLFFKLINLPEV
jgi:hypothetical protein